MHKQVRIVLSKSNKDDLIIYSPQLTAIRSTDEYNMIKNSRKPIKKSKTLIMVKDTPTADLKTWALKTLSH